MTAQHHISTSVACRMKIEELIVKQAVRDLLAAGYLLGINDGEEITIHHSRDFEAIAAKLFTTDEDYIYIYILGDDDRDPRPQYWVRCIYGNSGYDVLSDYSTHLEPALKGANELADRIENGQFEIIPIPKEKTT